MTTYVVTGVLGTARSKLSLFVLGVYNRVFGAQDAVLDQAHTWSLGRREAQWALEERPSKWVA